MKQRIFNYLFSNIANVIIPGDVITENSKTGKIFLGGKEVSPIELNSLISEIKALESMRVWSIINETVRQKVYEKGWRDSKTIEELNTAKAMFHTLDLQNSIIKIISKAL